MVNYNNNKKRNAMKTAHSYYVTIILVLKIIEIHLFINADTAKSCYLRIFTKEFDLLAQIY